MSLTDLPTVDLNDENGDDVFTSAPVPVETPAQAPEEPAQPAEPDPAVLAAERAEAERVRALGPEPHPEITLEMREHNPSNVTTPAVENQSVVPPLVTEQASEADTRQRWLCVDPETGIRRDGHPSFRSDAHLLMELVRCPVCSGISVRKVGADERLAEDA